MDNFDPESYIFSVPAKNKRADSAGRFNLAVFLRTNKPTIRAFLIFVFSLSVFFGILISHILDKYFVYPYTVLVAKTSAILLALFGFGTSVTGTSLHSVETSLNIGTGCNGMEAIVIFISAILAFPANMKNKLGGLALGFLGIFIINQTRVIGLFLVNLYASRHLDLAHTYIGQTYVIISGVALWIWWAEKISNAGKKILPAAG